MRHRTLLMRVALLSCAGLAAAMLNVCGTMGTATGPEETDGASDQDRRAGEGNDAGGEDSGAVPGDAAHPNDGGTTDAGTGHDAALTDSGAPDDTGAAGDTGVQIDVGTPDTGTPADTGGPGDTGTPTDTGTAVDTGTPADSGHPADAGHPDAGVTCTIDTGMPACDSCLASQCASQCVTCQGNPDCLDVVVCGLACDINDTTCLDNCASSHQNGAVDGANLYNCASDHCLAQCATASDAGLPTDGGVLPDIGHLPDGGSVLCTMQWGNQACTTCYQTACSSECQACAGNYDCVLALTCVAQCPPGNMTCMYGCVNQYPGSFNLIMAMYNCVSGSCKTQCGL